MLVRRLLVSAVLLTLAACSAMSNYPIGQSPDLKQQTKIGKTTTLNYQLIPRRSVAPYSTTTSQTNAVDTAVCLKQRLINNFKLPEEFISHKVYTDNNHSVGLVNPFTNTEGITMDVISKGSNSEIRLYDNGNLLSSAWKQLPNRCGRGSTSVVANTERKDNTATSVATPARVASSTSSKRAISKATSRSDNSQTSNKKNSRQQQTVGSSKTNKANSKTHSSTNKAANNKSQKTNSATARNKNSKATKQDKRPANDNSKSTAKANQNASKDKKNTARSSKTQTTTKTAKPKPAAKNSKNSKSKS